jgi:hypothetical protein
MKVILSNMCTALVGMLKPELGYYLRKRGKTFFSQRSAHSAPPDGHWRFIVLCAELAQNGLHISDIQVSQDEVRKALLEAGLALGVNPPSLSSLCSRDVRREVLSAADVMSIRSNIIRQNPARL